MINNQPNLNSLCLPYEGMKGNAKCRNWVDWG